MSNKEKCKFCEIGIKGLLEELPSKIKNKKSVPCKRGLYEDNYCVATLAPEQYTKGHSLLILKNHRTDIVDCNISKDELFGFINAIHKISMHLKEKVKNGFNQSPERIYVCMLCDGIEHLHAHLIPRYPFTDEEKTIYENCFKKRDSREEIKKAIESNELGGYWYVAYREKNYTISELWKDLDDLNRAKYFENLAETLRMALI